MRRPWSLHVLQQPIAKGSIDFVQHRHQFEGPHFGIGGNVQRRRDRMLVQLLEVAGQNSPRRMNAWDEPQNGGVGKPLDALYLFLAWPHLVVL